MTQETAPDTGYHKLTLNVRMDVDRSQPIMHVNFAQVATSQSIIYLELGVLDPREVHRKLQASQQDGALEVEASPQVRLAIPIEAAQQLYAALGDSIQGYLTQKKEGGDGT